MWDVAVAARCSLRSSYSPLDLSGSNGSGSQIIGLMKCKTESVCQTHISSLYCSYCTTTTSRGEHGNGEREAWRALGSSADTRGAAQRCSANLNIYGSENFIAHERFEWYSYTARDLCADVACRFLDDDRLSEISTWSKKKWMFMFKKQVFPLFFCVFYAKLWP